MLGRAACSSRDGKATSSRAITSSAGATRSTISHGATARNGYARPGWKRTPTTSTSPLAATTTVRVRVAASRARSCAGRPRSAPRVGGAGVRRVHCARRRRAALDQRLAEVNDQLEATVGNDLLRLDLRRPSTQAPQAPDERLELGARRPRLVLHVENLQERPARPRQDALLKRGGTSCVMECGSSRQYSL